MPVTRRYGCPECDHEFSFLHMRSDEPPPDYCPNCGGYMGDEPRPIPGAPNIVTWKGKTVDRTYRQMEEASEIRAELTGDPSQKITNLKDNLREGEVAAMAPQPSQDYQNATAQMGLEATFGNGAPGGASTADVIALAAAGARQGTGAKALDAIQGPGNLLDVPNKLKGFKASWQK